MKNLFYISLALIFLLFACQKPEQYPNEPQIDYQKIIISDSTIYFNNDSVSITSYNLIFNALDGDNNLGLKESDTIGVFSPESPYYYNAFVVLYKKENGIFEQNITYTVEGIVHTDTIHYNQRIPYTDPVGLNDYFKAEIKINIEIDSVFLGENFYDIDTMKFIFYVVDKDFNISNIQETQEIVRGYRGTLTDTDTVIIY